MKTTLKIFTLTAVLFGFATISYAQNSASKTADAGANIVSPITLTQTQELHFGDIVSQQSAFNVTMSADGVRSGAADFGTDEGREGVFTITGEGNAAYKVTFGGDATLTRLNGTETMNVTDFTTTLGVTNKGALTNGAGTFGVGAKLEVGATQQVGEYEGTYEVTVTYE